MTILDHPSPAHLDVAQRLAWGRLASDLERAGRFRDPADAQALTTLIEALCEFRMLRRTFLVRQQGNPFIRDALVLVRRRARGSAAWLGFIQLSAIEEPLGENASDELLDALADSHRHVEIRRDEGGDS